MKAVVTGAGGFVMANIVRRWLESDPTHWVVAVDASPIDDAARRYFAPVADRLRFVEGDVTSPELWARLPIDADYVVHGAAVTPHAYTDAEGRHRDPEREDPLHVVNVNVMGTTQALNWARTLRQLRRFVYVSTGSVYADAVPAQEEQFFPLPEDGYIGPTALYDCSKYAGELIAQRFKQLYGLNLFIVRLSSVFGPMDRQTGARKVRNVANQIMHAAAAGRALSADSLEAVGDYVYAPDVAEGICRLLLASHSDLRHEIYNIADGAITTVRDLVKLASAAAPGFTVQVVDPTVAELRTVPDRRTGKWAAYDISRAANDLSWHPRPLADAVRDYITWLRANGV